MMSPPSPAQEENKGYLLVVDDDAPLRIRLVRAMERKGFKVEGAESVADALTRIQSDVPDFAVVDLRLGDGYGLQVVDEFLKVNPDMRIVIVTAYGNIASAVKGVKMGAVDYLSKPVDADAIEAALLGLSGDALPPPPEDPMSADRVKWEHILRVFEQCDRNVSETARRLKMHRRTLQRILNKHAPQENIPLDAEEDS